MDEGFGSLNNIRLVEPGLFDPITESLQELARFVFLLKGLLLVSSWLAHQHNGCLHCRVEMVQPGPNLLPFRVNLFLFLVIVSSDRVCVDLVPKDLI